MGSLSFNRWMGLAAMLGGMLALVLVVMLVLAIIDLPSYSQWLQSQDSAQQEACTKYPSVCGREFREQGLEQAIFLLLGLLLPAPVVWGYAQVIARRMGTEERRAGELKASLVLALIGLVLTLVAGFAALGFGLTAVSLVFFLGLLASAFGMLFFGDNAPRMPSRRLRELPTHEKIMWATICTRDLPTPQRIFVYLLSVIALFGLLKGSEMAPFLVIAVLLGIVVLAYPYAIWGGYLLWVSGDETDG